MAVLPSQFRMWPPSCVRESRLPACVCARASPAARLDGLSRPAGYGAGLLHFTHNYNDARALHLLEAAPKSTEPLKDNLKAARDPSNNVWPTLVEIARQRERESKQVLRSSHHFCSRANRMEGQEDGNKEACQPQASSKASGSDFLAMLSLSNKKLSVNLG